jgi:hypothetical protein
MNGVIGGDLIAASAAIMLGSDAELVQKNVTITENGTYNYDPADDNADGYSGVTVGVEVDDGSAEIARLEQEIEDLEEQLANMGTKAITQNGTYMAQADGYTGFSAVTVNVPQSAAVTDQLSVTANGTYTPPQGVDGYDSVTVNVPTYQQEYEEMLECQSEIAELLDLQEPYDCEDIKQAIEDGTGYTFPSGTEYNDIVALVGDDRITDKTVGKYLVGTFDNTHYWNKRFDLTLYNSDGTYNTQLASWGLGGELDLTRWELIVNDSATGNFTITVYQSDGTIRATDTYTESAMIDFGATGNTFSVKSI